MISAAVQSSSSPNPWIIAARAAVVDLIGQALGLGCRVVDTPSSTTAMMGALIPISSDMAPVQIGLFGSEVACMRLARALLGNGPDDAMSRADMIDAMREIVNMFAGSVKARVARYATHAALGLPTFVNGSIEATHQQVVDRISVTVDDFEAQIVIARTAD
jgi:hypothetical protein